MSMTTFAANTPPPGFTPPEGAVPIGGVQVPIGIPATIGTVQVAVTLLLIGFAAYLCFRVARKAGYSGFVGLLALLPVVNVILLIWFALAEWPIERTVRGHQATIRAHSVDD